MNKNTNLICTAIFCQYDIAVKMEVGALMKYDVIIVGAGPSGIFAAYELMQYNADIKVAMLEKGNELEKRACPIDNKKIKSCIN